MISVTTVVRAAFTRFFPTGALLLAVAYVPRMLPWVSLMDLLGWISAMIAVMLSAAAGYGLALWLMRRQLSSDVPVLGRPSVVAGAVSPIVLMLILMQVPPLRTRPAMLALSVAGTGAVLALGMFFPWLAKTTESNAASVEGGDGHQTALPPSPFTAGSRTYSSSHVDRGADDAAS